MPFDINVMNDITMGREREGGRGKEKERRKCFDRNESIGSYSISSHFRWFRETFKIILITLILVSILDRVAQSLSAAMFFVARSEPEE